MPNYLFEVIKIYEKWVKGVDLAEEEVYTGSNLLGAPTRKLEAFLSRYKSVVGGLIEERCCEVSNGRVCIYTWNRRAYKRYFPAAIDAAGTIIHFTDESIKLVSYPLHRAFDVGVKGVELPREGLKLVTPRIDGWQVNLYWDPLSSSWRFSTRFVLHNMYFEGRRLVVLDYDEVVNPVVLTADRIASSLGLYGKLDAYRGWTFTFMLEGKEPATLTRRLPDPDLFKDYNLVMVAARTPTGELRDPLESSKIAEDLGVQSIASRIVTAVSVEEAEITARTSISTPSLFLWFIGDDKEHVPIYEVKSELYEDFLKASSGDDAKSLVILLTSGHKSIIENLAEKLGREVIDDTMNTLKELERVLSESREHVDRVGYVLRNLGIDYKLVKSALKAVEEGKIQRAVRIIAAGITNGWKVEDAPYLIDNVVKAIRGEIS